MEQMGINPDDLKEKKTRVGEVNIDKVPDKERKGSSDNVGEYVDFEEVDWSFELNRKFTLQVHGTRSFAPIKHGKNQL